MYNIHFESTQSRGQRIEEAMNNIAWDDMPADGIGLKEYDAPKIFKNDTFSLQKPNLKNSLRAFREPKEDTYEEENSLSKKIYDMEIERSEGDNSNSNNYLNNEEYYEEERKVHVEFQPPTTQKTNFKHITKVERNHYIQAMGHTQNSQDPEYMKKVAKALQGTKGKQKYSQKNFYPSSSTFILKKQQPVDFTQKSTANTNIREDIEDVDDIDEEEDVGGLYVANVGQKKLKLENESDNASRYQQQQPAAFEMYNLPLIQIFFSNFSPISFGGKEKIASKFLTHRKFAQLCLLGRFLKNQRLKRKKVYKTLLREHSEELETRQLSNGLLMS